MTSENTLDAILPGRSISVVRVEGEDALSHRLNSLGLWPGTIVEVVRAAPLGDPIQLSLRGYSLALRRSEASRVIVTRAEP